MKKLLVRIFFGFSVGVTLLVLSYLGIYYVAGQDTFISVILKLTDASVLQNQILAVGFTGIMLAFAVYIIEGFIEKDNQSPTMMIVSVITLLLALVMSMYSIQNIKVFDKATYTMILIISLILICIYMLFHCAKEVIDEFILNKKLKEKNR